MSDIKRPRERQTITTLSQRVLELERVNAELSATLSGLKASQQSLVIDEFTMKLAQKLGVDLSSDVNVTQRMVMDAVRKLLSRGK